MFQKLELDEHKAVSRLSTSVSILCAAIITGLTIALVAVVAFAGKTTAGLQALVCSQLPNSGVENPVTAVLLNFRSYDTLLEIAVLLVVAVAMLPNPGSTGTTRLVTSNRNASVDPVLSGLLRWLVPTTVVMAGYILWTGAYSPGGAFQAGALLAGAGVLISLAGQHQFSFASVAAGLLLTLGLIVFIAVGMAVANSTGTILQYPSGFAGPLILLIESAATISIAAILLLLYKSLTAQNSETGKSRSTS